MERLGADLFQYEQSHFLLIVDYYSCYSEVRKLSSLGSQPTVEAMKSVMATHSIPDQVISDNGPQFALKEFMEFAKTYGFIHITSFPRYPRSNGVGTIKSLGRKSTDQCLSLLTYRSMPLSNGY